MKEDLYTCACICVREPVLCGCTVRRVCSYSFDRFSVVLVFDLALLDLLLFFELNVEEDVDARLA